MRKATTLLFVSLLALTACNDDDDNNRATNGLEGNWKLVKVMGGFSGIIEVYTPGAIVWDFDESETNITVTNNAPASSFSVLATGEYEYEVAQSDFRDNSISVLFDDYYMNLGCPTVSNDSLRLENGFADGETYYFVR